MLSFRVVRFAFLLVASALIAAPVAARPARPSLVDRAAVETRLRAHGLPPSAETWNAVGPGVDVRLVEIAGDAKVESHVRVRAVSALGYFRSPHAQRFLDSIIAQKASSTNAADRLLVRKAAMALGFMGGNGVPARLGPLLEHADPDVRLDAAIGLGLTRLKVAGDILRKRFDVETVPQVRTQIGRQLRVIDEANASAAGRPGL